ncbi:MAG: hypothetical protein ACI4EH_05475, partial [Oliverpabstia sp.]
ITGYYNIRFLHLLLSEYRDLCKLQTAYDCFIKSYHFQAALAIYYFAFIIYLLYILLLFFCGISGRSADDKKIS